MCTPKEIQSRTEQKSGARTARTIPCGPSHVPESLPVRSFRRSPAHAKVVGSETKGIRVELWELVARESIRDLVARYNANGDSGRFGHVRELFCSEATMNIGDARTYSGIDDVMTIFTRTKGDTGATPGLTHVRHTTSTHQIDLFDEQSASGRLYFTVLTDIGIDHWGRYVDTYGVEDGVWKFTSRTVTVDGWAPNSLFRH